MNQRMLIAGILTLGIGGAGAVYAQSATSTTPTTTPPERMTGSTTTNNPATSATPAPGSPAALASPGTAGNTAPALGSPGDTTPNHQPSAAHSDATPGAPIPGANSFTEGEARSRIENHGFAQVSNLKLDNQGIWRGKASKDGKSVAVALDYQGNVVAR